MMRGPKPKPTMLRRLHGNPGTGPMPKDEPVILGSLLDPPDFLTESQAESWAYVMQHAPPGMLRALDRSVLVVWIVAEDLHRQACSMQAKASLLMRLGPPPGKDRRGNQLAEDRPLVESPMLRIINKQAFVMMRAAAELGFTPVSRTRVSTTAGSVPFRPDPGAQVIDIESYIAMRPGSPAVP